MNKDTLLRIIYNFYDNMKEKKEYVENEIDFKNELEILQDKHKKYSGETREEIEKLVYRKEIIEEITEDFLGELENYKVSIDEIEYELND